MPHKKRLYYTHKIGILQRGNKWQTKTTRRRNTKTTTISIATPDNTHLRETGFMVLHQVISFLKFRFACCEELKGNG